MSPLPHVGAVVLSMGNRPNDLAVALRTLLAQESVHLDTVLVGNGWTPVGVDERVRTLSLPENVGIPQGRNVGAAEANGEFLLFYDDDAALPSPYVVKELVAALQGDPSAATAQPRAVDPHGLPSPRRWVPRLRVRKNDQGGVVAGLWEGVFLIRRAAFDAAGGWPGSFFYGHEGIELLWRVYDCGWHARYVPTVVVHHPATSPTRHAVYYRLNARNRVWVARRNLPLPCAVLHVMLWTLLTVLRVRRFRPLQVWFAGLWEGFTTSAGVARPMTWRTVARLARAGRPPVI